MFSFCEQDLDLNLVNVGGLVKRGDTGRNSLAHVKIVTTARRSRKEEKDDMLDAIVLPPVRGRVYGIGMQNANPELMALHFSAKKLAGNAFFPRRQLTPQSSIISLAYPPILSCCCSADDGFTIYRAPSSLSPPPTLMCDVSVEKSVGYI